MTTHWLKSHLRNRTIKCTGTHWLDYRRDDIVAATLRMAEVQGRYEIVFELPKHFCDFIVAFDNYGDAAMFARKRKIFFKKVALQNLCQDKFDKSAAARYSNLEILFQSDIPSTS
jgi:hypothetical protein